MLVAALMLMIQSCVHQWPEDPVDPTEVGVSIWLHSADTMTLYPNGNPWVDTRKGTFQPAEEYDVDTAKYVRRYIVEINDIQSPDSEPAIRKVFTRSCGDTSAINLEISLHAVNYSVLVWQDFVDKATAADRYYRTDTLTRIHIIDMPDYIGSTDFKDASYCSAILPLSEHNGEYFSNEDIHLTLKRPLAKIVLVASDIDKFYYRIFQHAPSVAEATETAQAEQQALLATISNTVSISGYFPSGFNVMSGKPNDADLGYSFTAVPFMVGTYAVLGFDYVFIGENQTSVTVNMNILGKNGENINSVSDLVVPIARNEVTVVIDEFLTKRYTPGIGIDPEFDGEFNIQFIRRRMNQQKNN